MAGFVFRDESEPRELHLLQRTGATERVRSLCAGYWVLASCESRLAIKRDDDLVFFDVQLGEETRDPESLRRILASAASFSSDGSMVAIGVDLEPKPALSFEELMERDSQPEPSRLAVVSWADGSVTSPEGIFEYFASTPVWSDDERWIVFGTPFDESAVWIYDLIAGGGLQRLDLEQIAPNPLPRCL